MQIDPANGENGGVARALFINGLNNAKVYAPFAWMSAIKLHTNIRRAAGVGDIRGEHQHTPRETMAECYNEVVAPCVFCADTNQREVRREREMQIRVHDPLAGSAYLNLSGLLPLSPWEPYRLYIFHLIFSSAREPCSGEHSSCYRADNIPHHGLHTIISADIRDAFS